MKGVYSFERDGDGRIAKEVLDERWCAPTGKPGERARPGSLAPGDTYRFLRIGESRSVTSVAGGQSIAMEGPQARPSCPSPFGQLFSHGADVVLQLEHCHELSFEGLPKATGAIANVSRHTKLGEECVAVTVDIDASEAHGGATLHCTARTTCFLSLGKHYMPIYVEMVMELRTAGASIRKRSGTLRVTRTLALSTADGPLHIPTGIEMQSSADAENTRDTYVIDEKTVRYDAPLDERLFETAPRGTGQGPD